MLYLHIGAGKSGSTTIQAFLKERAGDPSLPKQLNAFGYGHAISLGAAIGTPSSEEYFLCQSRLFSKNQFEQNLASIWTRAKQEIERSSHESDYVASSEYLHGLVTWRDRDKLCEFRDKLFDLFGKVRVIVYVREQVGWMKSFYAQRVKGFYRTSASFREFVNEMDSFAHYWDHHKTISMWADAFGIDNVDVTLFDKINFSGSGLLNDFVRKLNCAEMEISSDGCNAINISPSYHQLLWMRIANSILPQKNDFLYEIHRVVDNGIISTIDRRKLSKFPTQFDAKILARVEASNAKFNSKFLCGQATKLPESTYARPSE